MKAVVLAGGKGTRLAPYTKILPKPLMPIGDMPVLEVLIRQMKKAGVQEVTLTVGHLAELLRAFFNDGKNFGLPIHYSYEDNPLGTAGPLAMVEGLESTFLVMNGDILTTLNLRDLVDFHKQEGGIATIAMHRRKVRIDLGVIECNGDHGVNKYIEKPTFDYMVSMGIYVFEPQILRYIPKGNYLDFPDLVNILLKSNERVVGYPFDGYWQDLGRQDDYEQASQDFELMRSDFLPED
ncbi:MAG TPA: sugar phosphate nucleotidyltransferase [Anaerolineaceae bacterium]|nr:sugar phosphate nucleotidyltransferase [Anaerolineaceae bacterium]